MEYGSALGSDRFFGAPDIEFWYRIVGLGPADEEVTEPSNAVYVP
jgi:hypothetical protein